MFTIPYQIGVSVGYHLLDSFPWFIITVCMNTCFFIDTFVYFVRAYDDTRGRFIIEPKTIRRNYIKSLFIPNLISNVPTTIIFYIHFKSGSYEQGNRSPLIILVKLSDLLKLLRLGRANRLLNTSNFVREFREKHKGYTMQLWLFVLFIVLSAHWFACIWSFTALAQVGTFETQNLLNTPNWIGNWYTSYGGPLNPLGYTNDLNRYVLSLFWAIQVRTSSCLLLISVILGCGLRRFLLTSLSPLLTPCRLSPR